MKIFAYLILLSISCGCVENTVSEPESIASQIKNKEVFDVAIQKIAGDKLTDFKLNKEQYTWRDLDKHYLHLEDSYSDLALDLIKVKTISSIFRDFELLDHSKNDKEALQKSFFYLDEFTRLNGVQSDLVIDIIAQLGDDLSNERKRVYIERTVSHNEMMIKSFKDGLNLIDLQAKKARMSDQEISKIKEIPISRIEKLKLDIANLEALL